MRNHYFIIRFWNDGYLYIAQGTTFIRRGKDLMQNTTYDRRDAKVYNSERAVVRAIEKLVKSKCRNVPHDTLKYSVEQYDNFVGSTSRTIRGFNTLEG